MIDLENVFSPAWFVDARRADNDRDHNWLLSQRRFTVDSNHDYGVGLSNHFWRTKRWFRFQRFCFRLTSQSAA